MIGRGLGLKNPAEEWKSKLLSSRGTRTQQKKRTNSLPSLMQHLISLAQVKHSLPRNQAHVDRQIQNSHFICFAQFSQTKAN